MARHGTCIDLNIKKTLFEIIEEKCSVDESDACSEIKKEIAKWPVCGYVRDRETKKRLEHYSVDDGEEPVAEAPARRIKRPHRLSEYQKHMSVCLLKNEGFPTCIQKWRSGDSMADEYRGSGMTK